MSSQTVVLIAGLVTTLLAGVLAAVVSGGYGLRVQRENRFAEGRAETYLLLAEMAVELREDGTPLDDDEYRVAEARLAAYGSQDMAEEWGALMEARNALLDALRAREAAESTPNLTFAALVISEHVEDLDEAASLVVDLRDEVADAADSLLDQVAQEMKRL